ncbi:Anaerobic nitric oxide reductase transcription regulator NorR [Sporomusa acidovorans DSM 3132]|uniref:Anaerobic nitric oxide reductase transcription regulator NorR n=2 Tax=Sporomusa TaxID=2375 RepID=A0ABZ3IYQ9_SPOA4|nr:limonene hydroxylase [Sporomusa acidovorans DSM 3132]SDF73491.1 Transcriptional regulator containing PAS, AAA-type ATPase, and DNA-binding Fis domains [Sporomusa acidovorans]
MYKQSLSDLQANCFTISKELLSLKRWQAILRCKQEFLENNTEDPRQEPYMDKEVAASWIRSRELGVNPYSIVKDPNLSPEQLSKVYGNYSAIIQVTNSLVESFKELIVTCGYIFYLFDKSGVILLNEGDWGNFPPFANYRSRTGIIASENSEGTTAHALCFRLRRPIQLLGPEHYCVAFQNSIASAAPVRNENGQVQAALVLVSKPLLKLPEEDTLRNLGPHSLILTTTMAVAIETQLKLLHSNRRIYSLNKKSEIFNKQLQTAKEKLITVDNAYLATSAFIDEGIITVDKIGDITHINPAALRILKLRQEEAIHRNINEFFENSSHLTALAGKHENSIIEERLCVGGIRNSYQIAIHPLLNKYSKDVDGAVLKFSYSEKSSVHNNNKSGSIARYSFADIITEDRDFKRNIDLAKRFAKSPENILIIGESGTGKELFAQAIHNEYSPQGPFMAVNCAAMPRELIESELFGYEGGSFTGAERSGKPGKIELAQGGTLFLDEIGDMPLELQAVLLRALEDKQIMRVGGTRAKKIDFRLIAATNKDLYNMVKEKQFREDLYFRLSVLSVTIPPLRARGNDVTYLSEFFIRNYCQKQGWKIPQIGPAAQEKIRKYQWPGNVRQLQNAMIYAVNTVVDGPIRPENLPNYILMETCPIKTNESAASNEKPIDMLCLEKLEKDAIETAMTYAHNYVPDAAEILGISRSTLYRKLKDYDIDY